MGQGIQPEHQERDLSIAARRAAVLGSPVAHSLSPVLHTAAYRALGLDDWAYEAIECDQERLPGLLDSLGPEWAGLSLTMPLKRAVIPLLTQVEPLVTQVGAANTVIFGESGRAGYNTDVPGMITALAEAGLTSAPDSVLVLGAGATACSALAALRRLGVKQATVAVRSQASAFQLLAVAGQVGVPVRLTEFGARSGGAAGSGAGGWQLLISTVPAGAADHYAGLLDDGDLTAEVVLDVSYHPWPTRLADAAGRAGAVVAGGFELLLHQAARQAELMTGRDAPVEAMRQAGRAALSAR
ncbi:MAG TPA: shikimate dehydrogenase [Streptosporangiaceae bacterium]|nr:shikimate dehydrogenase [Streptosporangiaceae bacterium]